MNKKTAIKIFEQKQIRSLWDDENEKWYFSIVDVIEILTETARPRKYWSDLKSKLKKEGSELSDKIGQLRLKANDGKFYTTDVADTEQLFRLIQSVPSPKAEPFKIEKTVKVIRQNLFRAFIYNVIGIPLQPASCFRSPVSC